MITPAGKITAIGSGTTTVKGEDKKGNTIELTVKVPEPAARSIYLNVNKNKTIKLTGIKIADLQDWTESTNGAVAVLENKNGKVTGKVIGKAYGISEINCRWKPKELKDISGIGVTFPFRVYVEDPRLEEDLEGSLPSKYDDDDFETGVLYLKNKKTRTYQVAVEEYDSYTLKLNGVYQTVHFTSSTPSLVSVSAEEQETVLTGYYTGKYPKKTTLKKGKVAASVNGEKITVEVIVVVYGDYGE
ncbi:MAG: hypothetical protein IJT16_11040 [Lachnospiraceae bacterium]|nr:hypothetical protein [Lachnospiraceae bacterium]